METTIFQGWHLNDAGDGCDSCAQADPSTYCGGNPNITGYALIDPSGCHPTMLRRFSAAPIFGPTPQLTL